jgi:hypothetical protein
MGFCFFLGKGLKYVSWSEIRKKGTQSSALNSPSSAEPSAEWSDVHEQMKSGALSRDPAKRQLLSRGVEFMVRRLVDVQDPRAEAVFCINVVERNVLSGEVCNAFLLPKLIRDQILVRHPRRFKYDGVDSAGAAVRPALARAVAQLSHRERSAASMYYLEVVDQETICFRVAISPERLARVLEHLRMSAGAEE